MNTNGTYTTGTICTKCSRPFIYVGDIPDGGFKVGSEPYCVCGTVICDKCGQRYTPKQCEHEGFRQD